MQRKFIVMVFCTFICFYCLGQNLEMEANTHKKLYPYLGANNLYGYADLEGNVLIEPQYARAGFFQNNVAIVRMEGEKEKLINSNNQQIPIPLNYNELKQHSFLAYTIIELTETYSNRWRFWEWQFLPDFSIMGSSSRNRLFDTEVMREKRSLYWLEGNRKIDSKKGSKGNGETYFYLNQVDENKVQVDDKLYQIENGKIKLIVNNVKIGREVNEAYFLQKERSYFRIIDSSGKKISEQKLQPLLEIELEVEGTHYILSTESHYPSYHKSAHFYKDDKGYNYIYPDLMKKFPSKINSYNFQDSINAMEILDQAQTFVPIPNSDRFLLVLNRGKSVFAIDTAGNWQNPDENMAQIKVVTPSGKSLWPAPSYELGTPLLPDGWNISSFRSLDKTKNWFKIHIKNEDQHLQGLWDTNTQTWIMPPINYQLGYSIYRNKFLSFQTEKNGKWGFYDLENQQVHISPTYKSVDGTGWVYHDDMGVSKRFYLDIENKKEFKEK